MMKKLALVALATTMVGTAFAQGNTYPYNLSVRGGLVLPIDSSYSDISSSFFGLGIDYTFANSLLKGGETFLSVDYQSKTFGRDKGSVFPVAINQKFFIAQGANQTRSYYFVGLGASFIDFRGSTSAFSGRAGFGTELGEKLFAEATLFLSDRSGGVRPNAIGLFLGYRF